MERIYNFEYPSDIVNSVVDSLVRGFLNLLLIACYIVICWLLLKFFSYVLKKIFTFIRLDKIQKMLNENELLNKVSFVIRVDSILIFFVKLFLLFLMILVGAEIFGLSIVSKEIGTLMMIVPKVFIALLILVGGIYFASWIKNIIFKVLKAIDFIGAKMIGNIVFYIILVFVAVTTLNQIGIDTSVITNNISIIIGALLLTVALSIGLGSKELVTKLLYSFYTRKNLEIGQHVIINGLKGYVISIDNIYLCLLVDGKKNYLPIKTVTDSHIEILD